MIYNEIKSIHCLIPELVPFVWSTFGPVRVLDVLPLPKFQSKLSPACTWVHVHSPFSKSQSPIVRQFKTINSQWLLIHTSK